MSNRDDDDVANIESYSSSPLSQSCKTADTPVCAPGDAVPHEESRNWKATGSLEGDTSLRLPLPSRPGNGAYRYHAFLSYSSKDERPVLEFYYDLIAAGFSVCLDSYNFSVGDRLHETVKAALSDSRRVILFCSRNANAAWWVEAEYVFITQEEHENRNSHRDRLLPVRLDDSDLPMGVKSRVCGYWTTPETRDKTRRRIMAMLRDVDALRLVFPEYGGTVRVTNDIPPSPFDEYRRWLFEHHSAIPVEGRGSGVRLSLEMKRTWVPLEADIHQTVYGGQAFGSKKEVGIHHGQADKLTILTRAFGVAANRTPSLNHIVVVGDPGSGKTTFLKQLLLQCLDNGSESLGLVPDMLPVYVRLGTLMIEVRNIEELIESQFGTNAPLSDKSIGQELVKRGNLLLLLDGLDEIANADIKRSVMQCICAAAKDCKRKGYHVAATTRFAGWHIADLRVDFLELHVKPFTAGKELEFIRNWFAQYSEQASGNEVDITRVNQAGADRFWAMLCKDWAGTPRLLEMTSNPLLLSILCLVWCQSKTELPKQRHKLYQRATEVLLKEWWESKNLGNPLRQDAQARLELIAYELTKAPETPANEDQLVQWLSNSPPTDHRQNKCPPMSETQARDFLHAIRGNSALLVCGNDGQYYFLHKTFQEYLTARAVVARREVAALADRFGQGQSPPEAGQRDGGWWDEIILLALSMLNNDTSQLDSFWARLIENGRIAMDPNLVSQALEVSALVSIAPFLQALKRPDQSRETRYAVLLALKDLLKGRPYIDIDSEILEVLAPLRRAKQKEVAQLASDLGVSLITRGIKHQHFKTVSDWLPQAHGDPRAGELFIHRPRTLDLELVYVPEGDFSVGSVRGETGAYPNEYPNHEVHISAFYLGKYPVTNKQYEVFLKTTGRAVTPKFWNDSQLNAPQQPVVGVNWEDADAFCKWAGLHLPSEEQWEYAARGPEGRQYPWGNEKPDATRVNCERSTRKTIPIGRYPSGASWVKAHDMVGNVVQWCQDIWKDSYSTGSPNGSSNATSSVRNNAKDWPRACRGGSVLFEPNSLRCAYRDSEYPSCQSPNLGFRVVLNLGASDKGAGD